MLISFALGILCDDYPTCGSASIYKLLIGEFFIIYYCRGSTHAFGHLDIYMLISFKFGIVCDDYPACGSASIYKLFIGEFFIIYYCRGCIP